MQFTQPQVDLLEAHGFEVSDDRTIATCLIDNYPTIVMGFRHGNYNLDFLGATAHSPRAWPSECCGVAFDRLFKHAVASARYFQTLAELDLRLPQ